MIQRRSFLALLAATAASAGRPANAVDTAATGAASPLLRVAGPPAMVSYPLVRLGRTAALADLDGRVEFTQWRDPDRLRALALEGRTDVLAMPVNVAANLYNRGVRLRLLDIPTWGILWVVSRNPEVSTLADLRGEEIAMPFRGDMPELLFDLIARRQGIDPRRDLKLHYAATPIDAMQLLLTRRVQHALLAEPAISMAMRVSGSFPMSVIAPDLYRAVDLQKEWGRVLERPPRIPQAGIVAMGAAHRDPELAAKVSLAYAEAAAWCTAHPADCGRAFAEAVPMIKPEAVSDSLAVAPLRPTPAREARAELDFLFGLMLERNPGLIGGRLPDDGFYAAPAPGTTGGGN